MPRPPSRPITPHSHHIPLLVTHSYLHGPTSRMDSAYLTPASLHLSLTSHCFVHYPPSSLVHCPFPRYTVSLPLTRFRIALLTCTIASHTHYLTASAYSPIRYEAPRSVCRYGAPRYNQSLVIILLLRDQASKPEVEG